MQMAAASVAEHADAGVETVQVTAFDGVDLTAWFFRAQKGKGSSVILLHGHGDNRAGCWAMRPCFSGTNTTCLFLILARTGRVGGNLATFGVKESGDVTRWVDWLAKQNSAGCVYGLGESMGAAILLQALPAEPRFCAAVAESPFSNFREVAYDRMGQKVGGGARIGRTFFRPLVSEAFLDARLQYGVDLRKASPVNAVTMTRVPILLIHGTEDFNIPVRHCQAILQNRSGVMEFWQVPGAGHTGALGREPQEFERRVNDWFSRYSRSGQ